MAISEEQIKFVEQFATIIGVKPNQTAANIKDAIGAFSDQSAQSIVNATISTQQTILALATSLGKSVVPIAGYTVGLASLANNVNQIKGQLDRGESVDISLCAQALSDVSGLMSSVVFSAAIATAATPAGPVLAATGGHWLQYQGF